MSAMDEQGTSLLNFILHLLRKKLAYELKH
jgi:hypothetical protein